MGSSSIIKSFSLNKQDANPSFWAIPFENSLTGFNNADVSRSRILNKSVDLASEKALSKYIKPIVDKEKVLIYERG